MNAASTTVQGRSTRARTVTNWVLALLTIPAAAAIVILAYGAVMSTSGCNPGQCEQLPSETQFTLMLYGPPVVSAVAVIASFFTARRPRGYLVPLVAWLLLVLDVLAMMFVFQR